MRSHVARDFYFYLNYSSLLVYYIYCFYSKIKIAPGEFDIRCLFIDLLRHYSVSYPPSGSPLFTLLLSNYN